MKEVKESKTILKEWEDGALIVDLARKFSHSTRDIKQILVYQVGMEKYKQVGNSRCGAGTKDRILQKKLEYRKRFNLE